MSEILLGIVGAILSLMFTYLPGLKAWLDSQLNRGLIMLAFCVLVAAVYFGLACSPWAAALKIILTCDQNGFVEMLKAVFVIASSNQITYLMTKQSAKG